MEIKFRPITHIITSGTGPAKSYSRYKIVLEGTIRETGDPARYCQWCKVGLGWNNNNPVYGSSYYTVESYDLVNGTYWATYSESNYPPSNLFVDDLYKKIDWTYNTGHKDDCYLEVIFNTNNAIVPTSIGLISPDNADNYTQRPEYFKLYGWDNGWDLITTVNGEDTLSGDNAESIFNISHTSSTIIRPVTIFENIPDPPAPTIPVVLMPDGKYWTSIDLNIDDGQGGVSIFGNVTVNGYNFGTQYYYTHEAAMRLANNLQGYHLPTTQEVTTLMNSIGGESYYISKKLRNTYGWDNDDQGTDDYGFTVLPVGNKVYNYDSIEWTGYTTHYWLYDDKTVEDEYTRFDNFSVEYNGMNIGDEIGAFGYKVRLIKD